MRIGFIISCHNKFDDLVAHLDIFKYYPFDHEVIVVCTMDPPEFYKEAIDKFHNVRIEGYGHYIGPLLSAVAGVREANKLGLDYAVYRNADDWLFNYKWEEQNFKLLAEKGYLCAGYNWLNVGTYHDITLNQLYFHIPSFYATADDAEAYFKRSTPGYLCEYKMPRWVKKTCHKLEQQFYRLPGREQEPGIGWERKDIPSAFLSRGMKPPMGFWERLENNNRFFNAEWQMIGSHDVVSRLLYWRKIRGDVPYAKQIEKDHHFARFMEAARNRKSWNLPGKPDPTPIASDKTPKLISRRIF